MRAQLIALADLSQRDLAQWRDLAAQAVEPNPFHEPEYVLPLAQAFGGLAETHILVVRDAGGWQACLPAQHSRRWHRIPLPSLSTWRGHVLYGLLGTPLVSEERTDGAVAALVRGMLESRHVTFAALEWVAEDGPLAEILAELLEPRTPRPLCFERFERAVLRRRSNPTYLDETLSAKRRRELRRQRRKLGEVLDAEPETVDRAGEDSAYDEFIALEGAGRKAIRGTVLAANVYHARFFREMCRAFAEQGRLQVLSLQAAGQTVALKCNLLAGDTIFFIKIAYDHRWSSLSPGIQLELDMIKIFHERSSARLMDSCADSNNAMINRLWPDRRSITTYVLPTGGAAGSAAVPVLLAARSLRNRKSRGRNT